MKIRDEEHFRARTQDLARLFGEWKYADGVDLAKALCEWARHNLGELHVGTAASVNNLAALYQGQGNYSQALPLFERALAIYRSALGEYHPDSVDTLGNLAAIYKEQGDYAQALLLLERALAIRRSALGETHPDTASSLNNLAIFYGTQGGHARELPLLMQALAIHKYKLGESHPNTAVVLNNLAMLCQRQGNFAAALPLHEEALAINRSALGETHPQTATSLSNLAKLYQAQNDYARALPLFEQALAILRSALGETHPQTATSLNNLAILYTSQRRYVEALPLFRQASRIVDNSIGQAFSYMPVQRRTAFVQRIGIDQYLLLSLVACHLLISSEACHVALSLVLRRKAVSTEAEALLHRLIAEGRYPDHADGFKRLNALRAQRAQKILSGPVPHESVEHHEAQLERWRYEAETLETTLARAIPEIRMEQALATADWHAIAACIPANGTLVEYVKFRVYDFHAVPARGESHWKEERYLAFIVTTGETQTVRTVDLGEATQIDEAIRHFRDAITGEADSSRGLEFAASASVQNSGAVLRELVIDPVLVTMDASVRNLTIAPDGELARLPFEALPVGDKEHLADRYGINYVATGRDLLRSKLPLSVRANAPLVMADPDFDLDQPMDRSTTSGSHQGFFGAIRRWLGQSRDGAALTAPNRSIVADDKSLPVTNAGFAANAFGRRSRELTRGSYRFVSLPGARIEGEQLSTRLAIEAMFGPAALEGKIKKSGSPAILHLATHGFFLPNQPWLNPRFGLFETGDAIDRMSSHENPMLRSGLAFAGANTFLTSGKSVSEEMEDGLLTAEDVAGLNLFDTELVFLSACETGLGDVLVGEGVYGLRRAFVLAGARTLIMSLWKVSDLATAILVDTFYERLFGGERKADALREAQAQLRQLTIRDMKEKWLNETTRERLVAGDPVRRARLDQLAGMPDDATPFTGPYYWAGFILQGDPGPLHWRPNDKGN